MDTWARSVADTGPPKPTLCELAELWLSLSSVPVGPEQNLCRHGGGLQLRHPFEQDMLHRCGVCGRPNHGDNCLEVSGSSGEYRGYE